MRGRVLALGSGLAASTALAAACGDAVGPQERLPARFASAHFEYFFVGTDAPDSAYQERHMAWLLERLELPEPPVRLRYHKYRDRAHLERITGIVTNGFAEDVGYTFHTIWPIDNHEYVHSVFIGMVGRPPALFSEGVAVAHHGASIRGALDGAPLWSGTSVHEIARRVHHDGDLPPLDRLIVTRTFREHDEGITYPVAGSFVRFLLDQAGVARFKQFAVAVGPTADRTDTDAAFRNAYDESPQVWWERWLAFLDGMP